MPRRAPGGLDPASRDAAMRWIADDVDPDSRAELMAVLAAAMAGAADAVDDLRDRMAGPLTFGTAGLPGALRAGSNGMNRAGVGRATAGLPQWLAAHGHGGGLALVGRDARHGSEALSLDAADV